MKQTRGLWGVVRPSGLGHLGGFTSVRRIGPRTAWSKLWNVAGPSEREHAGNYAQDRRQVRRGLSVARVGDSVDIPSRGGGGDLRFVS